jgi:hypothetical protein
MVRVSSLMISLVALTSRVNALAIAVALASDRFPMASSLIQCDMCLYQSIKYQTNEGVAVGN